MGPENGINLNEVSYFPMEDYVKKIHLNDYLLEHMEETNHEFDKYFRHLSQYNEYAIMSWFISLFNKEMISSQEIENSHIINPELVKKEDVFFTTLQMSHTRIKDIHKFVTKGKETYEYRKNDVRVSTLLPTGEEKIYWKGVKPEDLKKFMDDFITLYKKNSLSVLNTNPFFRSALMHLLFVRVHPFSDGNGRTARMIHNMCFTESINKIYGMKLKICPLNLSKSILVNKITYAKSINNIYFDLEHDCNDEINKWFDFMLNMVDEQLFFCTNELPNLDASFCKTEQMRDISANDLSMVKTLRRKA